MASKTIDTVIFDVGGVLVDYHRMDYFQQLGYDEEKALRLRLATFDSPDWVEVDRGVMTFDEILERFVRRSPDLEADIRKSFADHKGIVTRRDTAIPWIESVKSRGRRVYILSNFSSYVTRDCADALDFASHADGCYWSYQHRVAKPERPIFLDMLYEFTINPERAVFIDDSPRNLEMASSLGLHTILYQSQEQAERDLDEVLNN